MIGEHIPVLLQNVLQGLNIDPEGIYVDGTFGRGGHSYAILKRLGATGRLLALDRDPDAIVAAKKGPYANDPRFYLKHASFTEMASIIHAMGWQGKISGILLDLGISSPQLEDSNRGFSFQREGPLDMRMDPTQSFHAAQWLNQASEQEIARVLWQYGQERYAKRIARAIGVERKKNLIERTTQLAELIRHVVPVRPNTLRIHPATRTFQAIRILINAELQALTVCLPQCVAVLKKGGRLCVISFHSLEDRIVKQFILKESTHPKVPRNIPVFHAQESHRLKAISSLIRPSQDEISQNPRSRSARLRIAEKTT